MDLKEIIGNEVLLLSSQANWLQLKIKGDPVKIRYKGKVEYRLGKMTRGIFDLLSTHPLLLDHNESWQELFLNSRPEEPASFISGLSEAIRQVVGNWRDSKHYITKGELFRPSDFERNVVSGHGFIASAPVSVATAIAAFCKERGVEVFVSEMDYSRARKSILLIGSDFVIAEEFIISEL